MWFFPTGRVEKLEAEVASLKRDMQTRDLDWLDMRARCKRLLDRTQKASEYAELRAQEGVGAESGGTPLATGHYSQPPRPTDSAANPRCTRSEAEWR